MAIDFSNRDPKNKDAVYSIRPAQQTAWIETNADGSWTGKFSSTRPANSKGWQEVGYATVTLQDGRQFRAVLDGSGQPISEIGDTIGTDDDRARSWAQTGPKPLPPGATGTKNVNGRVMGYNPETGVFDIDQGEVPVTRTPEQQQTQAAEAQNATALNNERQWNSQHGYGWVTHAQRAEQVQKQQADARAENNQQRIAAAQEASNQLTRDRLQFDKDKANLPDVKAVDVVVNGVHYTRVTSITPQGATSIKNYGADGKEVSAIPSEGEASTGGPPMPEFVNGQTEAALRNYHAALWNDASLTPAVREKRFQEAVQVANIVVQSAATQENRYESDSNREYNVAHAKLDFMKTGLSSALDFVSKLNGDLPGGTGLGGKALAALLGIQMLQLQASGIGDVKGRPPIPTITNRDLSSNAAMTAHNQTVATQAAAAAQPAATPAAAPVAPPTATAASAPQPGAAAAGTASAGPPSATLPANRPDQTQAAPQIENAINPPPAPGALPAGGNEQATDILTIQDADGSIKYMTRANWDVSNPAGRATHQVVNAEGADAFASRTGATPVQTPSGGGAEPAAATPINQMPVPIPYPDNAGAESKMQPSDWPALASYGQPLTPPQPTAPTGQGDQAFVAAKRAQIAATPPWQLDPSDLDWAEQNGMLDEAMKVPGRTAA